MPPNNDPYFYITGVTAGTGTLYNLTTNIPANDPTFYGYNFTRWTMRVTYIGTLTNGGTGVVDQTLEVLADTSPGDIPGIHGQHRPRPTRQRPLDRRLTVPNLPLFPDGYPNGHCHGQLPAPTSPTALEPGYARSSSTAAGSMPSTARA